MERHLYNFLKLNFINILTLRFKYFKNYNIFRLLVNIIVNVEYNI